MADLGTFPHMYSYKSEKLSFDTLKTKLHMVDFVQIGQPETEKIVSYDISHRLGLIYESLSYDKFSPSIVL